MSLSTEDLINLAFESLRDDADPTLLTSERAHAIMKYENIEGKMPAAMGAMEGDQRKQVVWRAPTSVIMHKTAESVEAMLRQILLRILIDQPSDPVRYMMDLISNYKPKTVVICGAPATGKRTLGEGVAQRLGLEQVSATELVEGMMLTETDLGGKMRQMIEDGMGIPDELVEKLVCARLRERHCVSKGWVLDGWPRTAEQARNLRSLGLDPQFLVQLECRDQVVEDRVALRVMDPETGVLYHMVSDPPPLGVGTRCVARRGESTNEIIDRIAEYNATLPEILGIFNQSPDFQAVSVDVEVPFSQLAPVVAEKIAKMIAV